MSKWTVCALLAICLIVNGCRSTQIDVAPPCASIKALSLSDNRKVYGGQGILVGNRLLTAAHTFVQEGAPFPPNEMFVNGRLTWVQAHAQGNIETVRQLYCSEGPSKFSDFLEDWAAFEVQDFRAPFLDEWSVGNNTIELGQTLYAVRVDVNGQQVSFTTAPLIVTQPDTEEEIPERLYFVTSPVESDLDRWSGCFVGTYDESARHWVLAGILICGEAEKGGSTALHIVLRPPASMLDWLAER